MGANKCHIGTASSYPSAIDQLFGRKLWRESDGCLWSSTSGCFWTCAAASLKVCLAPPIPDHAEYVVDMRLFPSEFHHIRAAPNTPDQADRERLLMLPRETPKRYYPVAVSIFTFLPTPSNWASYGAAIGSICWSGENRAEARER
ncbi:hypothetical protein KSP39_PZI000089 [Platanthera zijinensis]|uniref:Uncharacterized protein n=1 Tax=Platanthera zijinensis TaxID=2320716 RepID=A0AAP0C1B0_9ASPA